MKRVRAYRLTLVAVLVAGAAVAAVAVASPTVAPRDLFHGRITQGRGSFRNRQGRLSVAIRVPQSTATTRSATLTLTGRSCPASASCIRLRGTLTGTLTRQHTIPDVGQSFAVAATGRVKPLGRVSASGQVHGTGFIMNGHELLTLQLSASHGTVSVQAQSPTVPGFTSP